MSSRTLRKRAAKKNPYVDEESLFSQDSRLLEIDLEKYFANPQAWEVLSEEEKQHLRSLLPPHIAPDADEPISQEFLRYDSDWRNAIRQFKIDLQAGRYEPAWQAEAAQAMEERAAGYFDNFKEEEFEEFWGQKQKVSRLELAGEARKVKFRDLIANNLFKEGDVWSFSKRHGKGKSSFLIEKDITIIDVQDEQLTFSIPPDQHKYNVHQGEPHEDKMEDIEHPESTASADGENTPKTTKEPIVFTPPSVQALGNKILEIDGRVKRIIAYNPFQAFRCKRNNQDMGGLWDIREDYYRRNGPSY